MTDKLILRPYQEAGIEGIRSAWMQGLKRVLLHLATGGGKTLCFCTVAKKTVDRGNKILVVVRGVKLVQQASDRLWREGLEHGILQGANSCNLHMSSMVASIDTLYARRIVPDADLIIIDECHLSFGAAYEWFLEQVKGKYILAVSATPHDKKRGMRHVADTVVYPISAKELTEQKYLCKLRYFAPTTPDLSQVRKSRTKYGEEYREEDLEKIMSEAKLCGDIVQNWLDNGENRKTLLFCSSIKHSKKMCERFRDAGVRIEHIDANTPDKERHEIIARLEAGETQIISNVNVLAVGVDIPTLGCLILARPTMSYNLHIQILGRGTRPATEDCKIFDHAGNTMEHGLLEDEMECSLDPVPKKERKAAKPRTITCEECFAIFQWKGNGSRCPACGAENKKQARKIEEENKLFEMKEITSVKKKEPWEHDLNLFMDIARQKRYKKGYIFHRMKQKHGEDIAVKCWPKIRAQRNWPKTQNMNG
jgi:superfamily II DNA or RNA helicase